MGALIPSLRTTRPARSNVHMTCCNCKTLAVKNRLLRTHCCSSSKIHFLYTLEDDYLQFLEQFFMHFYWFILLSSQFGSWTKRPADWSHRETPRWQNHGVFFLSSLCWCFLQILFPAKINTIFQTTQCTKYQGPAAVHSTRLRLMPRLFQGLSFV